MATLRNNGNGSNIRAGVVTAAEVNVAPSANASRLNFLDNQSGANWGVIFIVAAILFLYVVI